MNEEKEIWRDIPGYEGIYQASNFGEIKSLGKAIEHLGYERVIRSRILKSNLANGKYLYVTLCDDKIRKTFQVHQLIAMTFLNHKPCGMELVVNHINMIKTDNRASNLEIISNRENCNKKHLKSTSKYVGVNLDKSRGKWLSRITINGKGKNLGRYDNEIDAHIAYKNKLKEILGNE